jgi:hypothetical protein
MMRMLLAVYFVLATTVGSTMAQEKTFIPKLNMQDQFAKKHDLAELRGDVVVLVFADRGGAEASRDLGAKLHVHFHPGAKGKPPAESAKAPAKPLPGIPRSLYTPDAKMIPIAVIGEVPGALHIMVRTRFRQVAPDAAIWLDMTDSMRQQFDVKPDVPNFAVVDVEGRVRYTTSGKLDDKQFAELTQVVDALRAEGVRASVSRR